MQSSPNTESKMSSEVTSSAAAAIDAVLLDLFPEWDWDQRQCIAALCATATEGQPEEQGGDEITKIKQAAAERERELVGLIEEIRDVADVGSDAHRLANAALAKYGEQND